MNDNNFIWYLIASMICFISIIIMQPLHAIIFLNVDYNWIAPTETLFSFITAVLLILGIAFLFIAPILTSKK